MPTKIISSTMRSMMMPRLRNATGRTQLAHSSHTFDVQHERRGTHLSAGTMGRRAQNNGCNATLACQTARPHPRAPPPPRRPMVDEWDGWTRETRATGARGVGMAGANGSRRAAARRLTHDHPRPRESARAAGTWERESEVKIERGHTSATIEMMFCLSIYPTSTRPGTIGRLLYTVFIFSVCTMRCFRCEFRCVLLIYRAVGGRLLDT